MLQREVRGLKRRVGDLERCEDERRKQERMKRKNEEWRKEKEKEIRAEIEIIYICANVIILSIIIVVGIIIINPLCDFQARGSVLDPFVQVCFNCFPNSRNSSNPAYSIAANFRGAKFSFFSRIDLRLEKFCSRNFSYIHL